MLWLKRILVVGGLLISTLPVCAFTFSYGSWFTVQPVTHKNQQVQLPLTRKKYKNVKITARTLYQFLNQCKDDCEYPQASSAFEVIEWRAAATREGMWIADVEFNHEIILTVLVFQNKKGLSVKWPEVVTFKDRSLSKQVEQALQTQIEQTL